MKNLLNLLYVAAVIAMGLLLTLAFVLDTSGPVKILALELVVGVPVVWGMGRRVMS